MSKAFILLAIVCGPVLFAQKEEDKQWQFTLGGSVSLSSPAMSHDGSTIYIGLAMPERRGGRLVAVTPQGASRWGQRGREFSGDIEGTPAVGPAEQGGRIYVGDSNGRLYCLNPATGASIWERTLGGTVTASPAIGADGTIYIGTSIFEGEWFGRMYAYSPEGQRLWEFRTGDRIESSAAIAADGTIYF